MRCFFEIHTWNKWGELEEFLYEEKYEELLTRYHSKRYAVKQERSCKKCNRIQVKFQSIER